MRVYSSMYHMLDVLVFSLTFFYFTILILRVNNCRNLLVFKETRFYISKFGSALLSINMEYLFADTLRYSRVQHSSERVGAKQLVGFSRRCLPSCLFSYFWSMINHLNNLWRDKKILFLRTLNHWRQSTAEWRKEEDACSRRTNFRLV